MNHSYQNIDLNSKQLIWNALWHVWENGFVVCYFHPLLAQIDAAKMTNGNFYQIIYAIHQLKASSSPSAKREAWAILTFFHWNLFDGLAMAAQWLCGVSSQFVNQPLPPAKTCPTFSLKRYLIPFLVVHGCKAASKNCPIKYQNADRTCIMHM